MAQSSDAAQRVHWTSLNMALLRSIGDEFESTRPFAGLHIGVSLHLEAKTAVLLATLQRGGAEITAVGNYGSTQDEIVAYLNEQGIDARGRRSDSQQDHYGELEKVMAVGPDILLDNGADLVKLAIENGNDIRGATEETTSGHTRLKGELAADLRFPVIVINDSPLKAIVENKHAVGQSVYESFCRLTNLMPQGKRMLVVGYGWCGRGIAHYARANGAQVLVAEIDEIKALEAALDGFRVGTVQDLIGSADVAITATGSPGVVGDEVLALAPAQLLLANAGHFDNEIDLDALDHRTSSQIPLGNAITRHVLEDGRTIDLVTRGRMLNLAGTSPKGNSIESMDLGFALQARSLERIAGRYEELPAGAQPVPDDINRRLARDFVAAMNRS